MNATSTQQDKAILDEQIALLYDAVPLAVAASMVNAAIVAAIMWNVVPQSNSFYWFLCMLFILSYRLALRMAYKSRNVVTSKHNWGMHFSITAFATGCIWGAACIWLFPEDETSYQAFLAFVIAGMSAGASTSLSYLRFPITSFLFMALAPLTIRFFLEGGTIAYAMSAMTLIFGLMVFSNSMRIYENTLQNITLKFEAIDRERKLRSSEARYQYLFDSAPLGIIYYDSTGRVINYNQSFYKLFGIDKSSLEDRSLIEIIQSDKLRQAIQNSLQNMNTTFKGVASDFLGSKHTDIRVYSNRINDIEGKVIGGMSIVEDISEDRRLEKMKDEFISVVSHELRTPLTSIRGAIRLLQGTMHEDLNDKARELVDISNRNTEQLLSLINDILDTDKIESGKMDMHFSDIDIVQVINNAISEMSTYNSQNTSCKFETKVSNSIVSADENRLKQVMYNLLSNATKFSSPGNEIVVRINEEPDKIIVSISNHGQTISQEFAPVLFNRFTQADSSSTRMYSGSGLGLYISKAIIERHGGNIGFESHDDLTTFWFTLPRQHRNNVLTQPA